MKKQPELDRTITFLKDLRHATKELREDLQVFVTLPDENSLIEITEVLMVMPKNEFTDPYIVLRTA